MKEDSANRELTALLEAAADERPGAAAAFFAALLAAKVYVATLEEQQGGSSEAAPVNLPTVGKLRAGEHGFVVVPYQGRECLLIFTEEHFVAEWAGAEVPVVQKEFSSLLWLVGDEAWMYVNPNQEIGKELTSWEIEQLRRGVEAIPDLVSALGEERGAEYEVRIGPDLFPELRRKLLPVLELSKDLEEAFLIAVREEDAEVEKPLLGLRFAAVDPKIKAYIRNEVMETARDLPSLGDGMGDIIVIDDLDNELSPNHGLFEDAKPFYLAVKPYKRSGHGLKESIRSFFGLGAPSEPQPALDAAAKEEEE